MKKSLVFGCALALLAALVCLTGCPDPMSPGNNNNNEDTTYSISGTVTGDKDSKVSGASVQLMQGGVPVEDIAAVQTGEDGTFTISGLAEGDYAVKASMENYQDNTSEVFSVPRKLTGIEVRLSPVVPQIDGAMVYEAEKDKLVLTFNIAVDIAGAEDFSVHSNHVPEGLAQLAIATDEKPAAANETKKIWKLKLNREVVWQEKETITLVYTGTNSAVTGAMFGIKMAATTAPINVTNNIGIPQLEIRNIAIANKAPNKITFEFEDANFGIGKKIEPAASFTVKGGQEDLAPITVEEGDITATIGTLTLSRRVYFGENLTLSYDGNAYIEIGGNRALEAFADKPVDTSDIIKLEALEYTANSAVIENTNSKRISLTLNRSDIGEFDEYPDAPANKVYGFSVKVKSAPVLVSRVSSGNNGTVYITLANAVAQGDPVTFSYSGDFIKDEAGNKLAALSDEPVNNKVQAQAPSTTKCTAAVIENISSSRLTLTFDKPVRYANDTIGLSVLSGQTDLLQSISPTSSTGGGTKTITVTLNRAAAYQESITVKYINNGVLEDADKAPVANFDITASNKVEAPPVYKSAVIDGSTPDKLELTFDKPVKYANGTGLSVMSGQTNLLASISPTSSTSTTTITVTLNREAAYQESIKVKYVQTGLLQDAVNSGKVAAFDKTATNNVEDPLKPAEFKSAVIENSARDKLVLSFTKPVKYANGTIGLSVMSGQTNLLASISPTSSASTGSITITLNDEVNPGEIITVNYDKTTGTKLKGAVNDVEVENFSNKSVDNNAHETAKLESAVVKASDPTKLVLTFDYPVSYKMYVVDYELTSNYWFPDFSIFITSDKGEDIGIHLGTTTEDADTEQEISNTTEITLSLFTVVEDENDPDVFDFVPYSVASDENLTLDFSNDAPDDDAVKDVDTGTKVADSNGVSVTYEVQ
jgi:uncharacterized repeat protein (TIGR02059 family)